MHVYCRGTPHDERLIGASRRLTPAERNYLTLTVVEREALAVV